MCLISIIITAVFTTHLYSETYQGELSLDGATMDRPYVRKLGGGVMVNWYVADFFGKPTLFSGATVRNNGNKPMGLSYHVAFFDKNSNLIGAGSQEFSGDNALKPGESTQLGSCMMTLPKDQLSKIASYQVAIYEH